MTFVLAYVGARYIVPTPGCSLRPPGFYRGSRRGSGPPIFWNCGIVPCIEEKSKAAHLESASRSEEHTSELQSRLHLVCRLLLEKKKKQNKIREKLHQVNISIIMYINQ